MADLRLKFLGAPRITCRGQDASIELRKATALLVYLAVTGRSHTRDALATLFWPELDQSRARAGLRYALAALKKAFGGDWDAGAYPLLVDREAVRFSPATKAWIDVVEFEGTVAGCVEHGGTADAACAECLERLTEAARLYRGDFLAGFSLRDCAAFDDWVFYRSEGLRAELAAALERLASGLAGQGQYELAIAQARRWLALDPLHEPAHRVLMELYSWSGQRAAALRQYRECQRVLHGEISASPDEATTALYDAIKKGGETPAPTPERGAVRSTQPATILQDRYRLDAEVGRGGSSIVYRAKDLVLDRTVAVKVLAAALRGEGRARLLAEAQAAGKLNHPNLVSTYDAGEDGDAGFIVTEFVEGAALSEREPGDLADIVAIAGQVCAGLEHAHSHGIVHRDVKPGNVLVTLEGTAKLADFGVSSPVAARITSEGAIAGTVFYLAPELALGQRYDGRADLYALGVMLYELATGELPFVADEALAVVSQHIHAPVVPPRARNRDIPPALDALIVALLSKDPGDRPSSAAEVGQLLTGPELLDSGAAPAQEIATLRRFGRGRMAGREQELGKARALWSRPLAGQGHVLLISGEAGVGKTRLVQELVTHAQVSGGRALSGACYAEGSVPYAPFAQILRAALEEGDGGDPNLPDFVLADLLKLAPTLRLSYPDLEPQAALDDPQAEQQRLFQNLTICFTALSERVPLVLVVEDIHWAGSGTLFLLRHLARQTQGRKVLIVATHRDVAPDEARALHEILLDLRRERLATRLRLPRLDREKTGEMLAGLFAQEVPPDFLESIHRQTEGNPFFIEEVCKALVDSGRVYFSEGRWRGPRVEELGIPQSVQIAIESRVSVLPPEAQETIRLAAVLGREFDLATLADASDGDEEALIEALEHGERAQLIEEVSDATGGTFAFLHGLIAATLVEGMRTLQRRRLHRRAAVALEARCPDDTEALAYHYSQAGDAEKAAYYLVQAGDRARGLYAHREAIDSYSQALALLRKAGDLESAARTQMKLGLAYHNAFDFRAARQAYHEGFDLWQQVAERESFGSLLPAPHALRVTTFEPLTCVPGMASDLPSAVILDQIFSGLVEVGPEQGVVPDIAHSWEVLDGGRRYVFHLRDDVVWSDGVPVTAHDFEFTWKRTLDPANGLRWHDYLFDIRGARAYHQGEITDPDQVGVRALDDLTLSVELEGPSSYLPQLLAFVTTFPVPKHVVLERGPDWVEVGNMVTNGPFRLVSWERGESLVLERNPTYHGRFPGNVDRVEYYFLAGQLARFLRMYEEGDLDICGGLPIAEWARARQRYAGDYVSGPWLSMDFCGFDVSRPPFDDRDVRRAFGLAVDRETLADLTLRGYGFPATGGLVPPGMPGHAPGIALPYDPDAARRLLAKAGYPGGSGFPVIDCEARDDPGFDLICDYLQSQWLENLGVEVAWKQIGWGRFYDRVQVEKPHIWLVGWWVDYPDPDDVHRVQFWVDRRWHNEAYDRLVEGARRVMDQEARMRMYHQAELILAEEAPVLPIAYGRFHMLVKPWVRNYRASPLRWWFWKNVILEPH